MINDFISVIADKLAELFGNIPIYSENVPQGLQTACFYVKCINHSQNLMTNGKRKISSFDIMYIPVENSINTEQEINDVLAKLTDEFVSVEVENKIFKGTDISVEKVDGVLHYFVNFNFNTLYKNADIMDYLKLKEVEVNGN
ncbi:MAG: DUF6838 family protein [Lachnospirales bacterium]